MEGWGLFLFLLSLACLSFSAVSSLSLPSTTATHTHTHTHTNPSQPLPYPTLLKAALNQYQHSSTVNEQSHSQILVVSNVGIIVESSDGLAAICGRGSGEFSPSPKSRIWVACPTYPACPAMGPPFPFQEPGYLIVYSKAFP